MVEVTKIPVRDDTWARWLKAGRDSVYVCKCSFEEKDVPKGAGFRWNPDKRTWWTDDIHKACKLAEWGDSTCREELDQLRTENARALEMSRAAETDFNPPCPENMDYFPYQKAGIHYALRAFGDL